MKGVEALPLDAPLCKEGMRRGCAPFCKEGGPIGKEESVKRALPFPFGKALLLQGGPLVGAEGRRAHL